jgi:hypothetical protein
MLYRTKRNILRSVVFLHDGYRMVCFKKKKGDLKMAVIDIFQTQLVVTTECKRERFIYFFSCSYRTQEYVRIERVKDRSTSTDGWGR